MAHSISKKMAFVDPLAAISALDTKLDSCMASFESRFKKVSPAPNQSLEQLAADIKQFQISMKLAIELIRSQIDNVTTSIDEMENRSRRKFLIFRGIKETAGEILINVLMDHLVNKLKLQDLSPECIHFCYRLGKDSARSDARPILVKFTSTDTRSIVWRSKTALKGSSVSIAEYLTASRRLVFNEARKAYGVHKCWSQNGNVYLLTSDGCKNRLVSLKQLQEIMKKVPPVKAVPQLSEEVKTQSTSSTRPVRKGVK